MPFMLLAAIHIQMRVEAVVWQREDCHADGNVAHEINNSRPGFEECSKANENLKYHKNLIACCCTWLIAMHKMSSVGLPYTKMNKSVRHIWCKSMQ